MPQLHVRCLACGEILLYDREYTIPLIEHLRQNHPTIQVARLPFHSESTSDLTLQEGESVSFAKDEADDDIPIPKDLEFSRLEHTKKYIYSVETWHPGTGKIVCHECGSEAYPTVRRHKTKMTSTPMGACLTLGCWPFCFLPFGDGQSTMNLYCTKCSHFLGAYDKGNKRIVDHTLQEEAQEEETTPILSAPSFDNR